MSTMKLPIASLLSLSIGGGLIYTTYEALVKAVQVEPSQKVEELAVTTPDPSIETPSNASAQPVTSKPNPNALNPADYPKCSALIKKLNLPKDKVRVVLITTNNDWGRTQQISDFVRANKYNGRFCTLDSAKVVWMSEQLPNSEAAKNMFNKFVERGFVKPVVLQEPGQSI